MKNKQKYLIVILGPTGIGKTDLSINLAKHFKSQIISSDSRQIYKEISIGTAKPSQTQLNIIPHHLIGHKSIQDYYNAYMYETDALESINKVFEDNNIAFLVGGSGLYINSICYGIDDLPTIDIEIRENLLAKFNNEGVESLRKELKIIDPDYYEKVDLKNHTRILKALEVYYMTGKPYSSLLSNKKKKRTFNLIFIGLNIEREILYMQINKRVLNMMNTGLLAEAKSVYKHKGLNALNTVGYKELFEYFDGKISLERAIELIQRNSRRYAKRQISWFHRYKETKWFHPSQESEIIDFIDNIINEYELISSTK